MTRSMVAFLALVAGLFMVASSSSAAPFEELFRIEKITGDCNVQPPASDQFLKAVDGNAYPYGTKIKTGRKSSATVVFSDNNICRILANAALTITKDVKDEKIKNIELGTGRVEIKLEPEFHKTNNDSLNVVTPTAICGAIGCTFSVESRNEMLNDENLLMTVIVCDEGEIKVTGHGFEIPMDTEDGLSISSNSDGSFVRLKNIKGMYAIQTRGADGATQQVETKPGSMIKVWRTKSATGNVWIMTLLITAPDGTLQNSLTYNEEITGEQQAGEPAKDDTPAEGEEQQEPPVDKSVEGEAPADEGTGEEVVLQTTTTTTTSTTTTTTVGVQPLVTLQGGTRPTVSSPTPVGKRF